MPIAAAMPPQTLTTKGGFDYVTVDVARRRVYAAHGGAGNLLVVDADSGKVLGEVPVGHMAGVAVNPENGHVFTGDGEDKAVSEVDPGTLKEVHRVAVDGPVDAIQYDASNGRIYADEDDGTRIFVIDAKTFKQIATVKIPGHKPEYLQVNSKTHEVYQNIDTTAEIAVVNPKTLTVQRSIKTPELTHNHPLQLDGDHDALFVAGENGVMSVYSTSGKKIAQASYPGGARVDQCDLDRAHGRLACFGSGIKLFSFDGESAPKLLAEQAMSRGVHTGAIDSKNGRIWTVWSDDSGAHVQSFDFKP